MKLYIDLRKAAGQTPSIGRDTPKESQSTAENKASYARRYEGVASGEALDPDRPEVGGKWKHDEEDTVSAEDKASQKDRTEEAQKDGLVKKSMLLDENHISGSDLLYALNKSLAAEKLSRTPNPREQEFLREVLGYSQEDINKGIAVITGKNRSLFNRWLCDRLTASTDKLTKSLGARFG